MKSAEGMVKSDIMKSAEGMVKSDIMKSAEGDGEVCLTS